MLTRYQSEHYASRYAPGGRSSRSHAMHQGDRPSRSHTMHIAAGREYRLFRARALRPGNERGCVEPPELERSPQLVTAGRDVRRWCLLTASIPRRLISSHLISSHLHLPPPNRYPASPHLSLPRLLPPVSTLPLLRRTPFLHILECQQFPVLLRGKCPKAKSQHSH